MSTFNQSQRGQETGGLWQAIKDLDFLSRFFSWFFMLLTRLSEPLMLLATLYIIAQAGVPSISVQALYNLCIGIMITAPEVILPGSFVVASQARSRGERHARVLLWVCWAFVGLTMLTLISLFVWHFSGIPLEWLMCARCAAAVGYSVLMRVMSHSRDQVQMVSVPDVTEHFAELSQRLEQTEQQLQQTIAAQVAETERRLAEQFGEIAQRIVQHFDRTITEQLEQALSDNTPALPNIDFNAIAALPAQLTLLAQDTQAQLRAISQETLQAAKGHQVQRTTGGQPKFTVIESKLSPKGGANAEANIFDKGDFVRSCLSENPQVRNSEIQRLAAEHGVTISPAYISETRKAFFEDQEASA